MVAEFVEETLDLGIDYGAVGGPEFSTAIVQSASGREARNVNWEEERGRWQIGNRAVSRAEKDYLLQFFRARRGKAVGFRWRDWNDYVAAQSVLPVTGAPTAQLVRTADNGYRYEVVKPRDGVILRRNGSALAVSGIDDETGIVTFNTLASANISGITQANPGVVTTSAAHGYTTGDRIWLSGIGGMTALNNTLVDITVTDPDKFSIGIDTTGMTAYTSGGTAAKYPQPSDTLDWSGEYDKPVRFDNDQIRFEFQAYRQGDGEAIYGLGPLAVVEIRL